jgi:hypothetical protein
MWEGGNDARQRDPHAHCADRARHDPAKGLNPSAIWFGPHLVRAMSGAKNLP